MFFGVGTSVVSGFSLCFLTCFMIFLFHGHSLHFTSITIKYVLWLMINLRDVVKG